MKKMVLAFALLASAAAQSVEIKLLDEAIYGRNPQVDSQFQINRELGRAWIELDVHTSSDPDSSPDSYRTLVPGLSFDQTHNSVVLESEGQLIECAVVRRAGWPIKYDKFTSTGNCEIVSRKIKVDYDNGFEIKRQNRLQVFLITK